MGYSHTFFWRRGVLAAFACKTAAGTPRLQKSARASVTLVALCLTTALGIALGSYVALCTRSTQFSTRLLQQEKARELVQVGLEEALWALNRNTWNASGPNGTSSWTTAGATVTPREKGRMHVLFGEGVELDAHIDVLATPQRIRLILLPTRGMPGSDAVIVEDFLFERSPASTVVRLLSSGVPSRQDWVAYYLSKRRHWELALTRLKVFLEKGLDQEEPPPRY